MNKYSTSPYSKAALKNSPKQCLFLVFLSFLFEFLLVSYGFGQTTLTYTTSGTWVCPAGVTSIQVQAWGAGGAGGNGGSSNGNAGGGGGGGAYTLNSSVSVNAGTTYTITIGTGGIASGTVGANGGNGGASSGVFGVTTVTANGGAGGQGFTAGGAGGTGGTGGTYDGGSGAAKSSSNCSGGGGEGAGTTSNGGNASMTVGGSGTDGGNGANAPACGNFDAGISAVGTTGVGGGGSGSIKNFSAGSGFRGQMILTYTCPSFGTVTAGSNQTLAACATTTTLAGSAIPSGMTGTWSVVSGTATITSPNSPTSGVTGLALPATNGGTLNATLRWTISNGACGTSTSDVIITTSRGAGCFNFCASNATSSIDSYIGNVIFNTLNNSSTACTGYTDFTGVSTSVYPGMSYTLTITKGTCGGTYTGRFVAWIDWNLNGVFDATELVLSDGAASNGPVSVSVTVPTGATAGTTRMRCIFREGTTAPSECGTYTYGETEDYSIVVNTLTACSGTPSAGTTSITPSSGCTGASVTMSSTGTTAYSGLTFQWQKSTDGGSNWSNIGSSMSIVPSNYSDAPTVSSSYRLYVICSNSGLSATSNTQNYTVSSGTLSVKTWIGTGAGGTGTDFNAAANWNPASSPTSCDSIRMILNSAAVITMSANSTIGALVYNVSGGVTCELDVQTRVLTIEGTSTYDGTGSGTWAQVNVRSSGAGIINKGNCVFHNTGTGITYLYAATSSPGKFQLEANLTVGTGGRTAAGIEPVLIFDAVVSQSWNVNNTVTYFLGEDVIFGLTNSPTITLGGGSFVDLSVYDGDVEINNSTIVKAMNVPLDKYTTTAGIFFMNSGSKLELNYTNDMPVGTYTYNLDPNSTVEYLGVSSVQSVNGITYGHLISGGSGNKTAAGNIVIAGNFLVRNGSTYLGSTRTHNFKQNFTNDGTFTANTSSFIIDGAVNQYIQGTVSTSFYNLTINKSVGVGYLEINTQVGTSSAGVMAFTAGALNLNSKILTINNSATGAITRSTGYAISENTANTSKIQWNMGSTTGSHIYPFGTVGGTYVPFTFNLTAGTIGNVTLSTYPTAVNNTPYPVTPNLVTNVNGQGGLDNSANTVDRFWQIDKTGASGTATLTFMATASEVGSIGTLMAQRWNTTSSIWEAPLSGQTSLTNGATVPGVTNFSPWTLSGNGMPLPIELLYFDAIYNGEYVDLVWSTSSESNNDFFTVERTIDGINYELIDIVKGAGNSTTVLKYETVDTSPYVGIAYYRLKQTDYDGKSRFSQLEEVEIISNGFIEVFPNPTRNNINISYYTEVIDISILNIFDAKGRLVHSAEVHSAKGKNVIDLDLQNFTSGMYIISIANKNEVLKKKFVKE